MAKQRTIEAKAINIRLHDMEKSYSDLIRGLHSSKFKTQVYGDKFLTIRSLRPKRGEDDVFFGTMLTYTRIDPDAEWYDESTDSVQSIEELEELQIPQNLHPNAKSFFFMFFARGHKLVYESHGFDGSLSERQVVKFFEAAFKQNNMMRVFGPVEVDAVFEESAVDELLSIYKITNLEILLKIPNPDDLDEDLEKNVLERLKRQNAKSEKTHLVAAPGKSLEPSNDTRNDLLVATRNGNAKAWGKNEEGTKDERQLSQFPMTGREKYDPEALTQEQAFERAVTKLRNKMNSE